MTIYTDQHAEKLKAIAGRKTQARA